MFVCCVRRCACSRPIFRQRGIFWFRCLLFYRRLVEDSRAATTASVRAERLQVWWGRGKGAALQRRGERFGEGPVTRTRVNTVESRPPVHRYGVRTQSCIRDRQPLLHSAVARRTPLMIFFSTTHDALNTLSGAARRSHNVLYIFFCCKRVKVNEGGGSPERWCPERR